MEALKVEVEVVEINAGAANKLVDNTFTELNDLELAMVGGGSGDVCL